MTRNIFYLIKVINITTRRFFADKYTFRASALAFTTLLSLVPILSVIVSFITVFPIFSRFVLLSKDYIFRNFVPTTAYAVQDYFQNFIQQAVHLPVGSILFLAFTAILMINTIDETINDIWHIPKRKRKATVWLFYIGILVIVPILIGASIFITSHIFSTYFFSTLTSLLFIVFPIIINAIIFSLFYIFSPNTYVSRKDGILGGCITAFLIEITRILFATYVSLFSSYELIYGVFSILPIFLVWLYILWFIILWGAIFTHSLSHIRNQQCKL